jgi:hypothetical protein
MSKLDLPAWAKRPMFKTVNAQDDVNAQGLGAVNAQPKKSRSGSKHPPGYMTEYMRKRRAK